MYDATKSISGASLVNLLHNIYSDDIKFLIGDSMSFYEWPMHASNDLEDACFVETRLVD